MNNRHAKPWPCTACGYNLGYIVFGELTIDGQVNKFNTDKGNVILYCPECEARKIWFSTDRLSELLKEFAKLMVDYASG